MTSEQKRNTDQNRLWSSIFVIIIGATLFFFLVGQGLNSATSVYLERIGGSSGLAGIGALSFSVSAATARIISGPIIDNRGRAIAMITGSIVLFVATIGPLFANNDFAFILWRVLQGVGFAVGTTATATAAADVLPESRLGEGIGYYGLGQAISMSVGPAFAIFLASTDPAENFYIGLSCCTVFAFLLSCACRYEKNPDKLPETSQYRIRWMQGEVNRKEAGELEPVAHIDQNEVDAQNATPTKPNGRLKMLIDGILEPSALPGTIPMMFIATSFGFGIFFVGVLGGQLGIESPGIFYTVGAVSMICIRLTSGKFMDKVRPIFIMGGAVICGLLAYGMFIICAIQGDGTDILYYLAGIPYGLSLGVSLPINQTIAVRLSPPDRWGAANGLYLLGNDLAIGVSSLIWGILIDNIGFAPTLMCVIVMIALSLGMAAICYPKEKMHRNSKSSG